MQNQLLKNNIREIIRAELPKILKETTEDRIESLLKELKQDRERQDKKWDKQDKKWEEQNKKWEEQNKKWEENQKIINTVLDEIKKLSRKHDSTIGALGSRWGLHTEASFRNGLRAILEKSFGVKVENYLNFDSEGIVFDNPDQVELDIIIYNGSIIICEIKSSMSKSDLYIFSRKVKFYELKNNKKASRIMVISPMIDKDAMELAKKLEIEVYSYAEDITI